jgi:hypothetical protein
MTTVFGRLVGTHLHKCTLVGYYREQQAEQLVLSLNFSFVNLPLKGFDHGWTAWPQSVSVLDHPR